MTDLVDAYQRREVHSAEKILRGTIFIRLEASFLMLSQIIVPQLWMTASFDYTLGNFLGACAPSI